MRLLRSWPARIPEGRTGYVVDGIERLVMDNHDYRVLGDVGDDCVLLEWDLAIGLEELDLFMARAKATPQRVLVAPYRIYVSSGGLEVPLRQPIWAHRVYVNWRHHMRFVQPTDPFCHLFAFGMIYLPQQLVRRFLDDCADLLASRAFDDTTFSSWHSLHVEDPGVPIAWDVRPVHLHYPTPVIQR